MQQITRLRQTAAALEGLLGRDHTCQLTQAEALAQLKQLDVDAQAELGQLDQLWNHFDAEATTHPEQFQESLQRLLPDLSHYSEITVHLLHQLVLACGDVSLASFVRVSQRAVAAARTSLQAGCAVVTDVPAVAAALDHTRLAHLGCPIETLINDPHIAGAHDAEQTFWSDDRWRQRLQQAPAGCVLVIGYAPSVLLTACQEIAQGKLHPALVIGMPIGFSHAPAAKRQLMALPRTLHYHSGQPGGQTPGGSYPQCAGGNPD